MIQIGSWRGPGLDPADQRITFVLSREMAAAGVAICLGVGESEARSTT